MPMVYTIHRDQLRVVKKVLSQLSEQVRSLNTDLYAQSLTAVDIICEVESAGGREADVKQARR